VAVLPYARGNTDFQAIGETDVLDVVRKTEERFGTDPEKVYLMGISMGGGGVWSIGCHYPDGWAALMPIAGRTDYYLWKGIDKDTYPGFKKLFVDADFAASFPENISNVPVFVSHGDADWLVKPEQSKLMVAGLKDLGADVTLVTFPGAGHNDLWSLAIGDPRLAKWLAHRKRTRFPRWIGYKTYTPEYHAAWWVSIDRIAEFGFPARVEAAVGDGRKVTLKTTNVASLSLDTARLVKELGGDVTVEVDGNAVKPVPSDRPGWQTVELAAPEDARFAKNARVAGPFRELFDGPFMIVVGTGGLPEDGRRAAMNAAACAEDWYEFAQGRPRMKLDTEVTPEDVERYNLFLFGTTRSNRVLGRIGADLPVRPDADFIKVGDEKLPSEGLGLLAIYPNPLNPERYVAVESGVQWGGALEGAKRWLTHNHRWDWIGDFVVYTNEIEDDGTNKYVVAGYFDENWRLAERLTWWTKLGKEKAAEGAKPAWLGDPFLLPGENK
jgi:hypothetical protein